GGKRGGPARVGDPDRALHLERRPFPGGRGRTGGTRKIKERGAPGHRARWDLRQSTTGEGPRPENRASRLAHRGEPAAAQGQEGLRAASGGPLADHVHRSLRRRDGRQAHREGYKVTTFSVTPHLAATPHSS